MWKNENYSILDKKNGGNRGKQLGKEMESIENRHSRRK